jgi:hypothetical protein
MILGVNDLPALARRRARPMGAGIRFSLRSDGRAAEASFAGGADRLSNGRETDGGAMGRPRAMWRPRCRGATDGTPRRVQMRRLGFLLLVLFGFDAYAQETTEPKSASLELGPRVSIELRDFHIVFGGELRLPIVKLTQYCRLDIRPEFNYYIYKDTHALDVSADALFDFPLSSHIVDPYVGAGLGIFDCPGCSASLGVNLLAGAKLVMHGSIHPFAEIRFTIGDFKPVLLTGGILFAI